MVSNTSASTSVNKSITATCSSGKALGGGYLSNNSNVGAQSSYPSSPTVWHVDAVEFQPTGGSWTITAYVICG
jgi:hypothetical protein